MRYRLMAALAVVVFGVRPCAAINIVIDYTHDAFFASHAPAMSALEQAALDLEAAITTDLPP